MLLRIKITCCSTLLLFLGSSLCAFAQLYNPITVAAPFLQIAPDARSNALGAMGVATSPDVNAAYWNVAKLAFLPTDSLSVDALVINIKPLTSDLTSKINNYQLSYIRQLPNMSAFHTQLTYFSLGNFILADNEGNTTGIYNPNEFALSVGYSKAFGEDFSLGIAVKYVSSQLNSTAQSFGQTSSRGTALLADIGFLHQTQTRNGKWLWGVSIANLGTKMQFSDLATPSQFVPTTFRLGVSYLFSIDEKDAIQIATEVDKLLVPTPQLSPGAASSQSTDMSVWSGISRSFYDAQGGWSEELAEVQYHASVEWSIDRKLALRLGAQHQSKSKGSNRFITTGLGYNLGDFDVDIAYLFAYGATVQSVRNNTLCAGLSFRF